MDRAGSLALEHGVYGSRARHFNTLLGYDSVYVYTVVDSVEEEQERVDFPRIFYTGGISVLILCLLPGQLEGP